MPHVAFPFSQMFENNKAQSKQMARVQLALSLQFKLFFYVNINDKRILISLMKYAFEACGKRGL